MPLLLEDGDILILENGDVLLLEDDSVIDVCESIANDFVDVVDCLQGIALKRTGSNTTTSIGNALRRALSNREAQASGGKYTQADVTWHFSVADGTPYVGDTIVPDNATSEIYTVLETHKETLNTRWRCITRDLAIVNGLDQVVTILERKTKRGTSGAAEYTETEEVKTGFKAKLHLTATAREIDHGRRSANVTATLFMSEPFALDNRHVIRESNGTEWEVVSYQAPEEIGLLPFAFLERNL